MPFSPHLGRRFIGGLLALFLAHGTAAMSVVPPSFPELVDEAEAIVRARVAAVESRKVPTPTGDQVIRTFVTLKIADRLKGDEVGDTVTLSFLGGQVGDETLRVAGMPRFHVGDEDFLFVVGNGRVLCPLVGASHGRYPVLADATTGRRYIARANHTPLRSPEDVGLPLVQTVAAPAHRATALTPDAFARAIRARLAGQPAPEAASQ